uniref:A kinase (PRKA) anchor protein 1b n=1 Tax=Tetraodon nigroviridis TaxID=99883 RepID=H3CHC4_TETNG
MPLRFRAVVPYTLPGVLALMGCWWYLSRKKRSISRGSPEGPSPTTTAATGLKAPSAEGSNGLLEGAAHPTHTHRADEGTVSRDAGDAAAERRREERQPARRCSTGSQQDVTDAQAMGEELAVCGSAQSSGSSPSAQHLSEAERPEPEGEVAVLAEDTAVTCTRTPPPTEKETPPELRPLETPPSAQEFNQQLLSSTPTAAQEPASRPPPRRRPGRALQLLASGLITEVISAATQEVLSCTPADGGRPPCSSTPLQEPIAAEQPRLPRSAAHNGCQEAESEDSGMPNGCSPLQTNGVQTHDGKLAADEASVLAEDSACSTCHSEDGGGEQLQDCTEEVMDVASTQATTTTAGEDKDAATDEIKRLNGLSVDNGGVANEAETDQSGGSDVNSMDSVDSGCTMGASEAQGDHAAPASTELIVWEIEVPKALVGRLIGKQGRYVSYLKQNSGAKIYISTLPYTQDFQICHIEGTQQQVDKALALIGKKFKDLDLSNLYAPPPPPLTLPSLPMTSWLLLPSGVTVEVIVVNIVSAGHVFVQQHTHPTYHALRSLDQQMFLCYSQPSTPALPSPAEVGVICAAPAGDGAWWRAQVITFYKDTNEVEIRYVDYGGYHRVKVDSLRQIRSDFVTLPFQGAEVLLDNVAPLPGEDRFSAEATSALEEMTRGVALLAQVSNYDNNTGLPLVHLWNVVGDEVVLVNRTLVERGLGVWVDGF